MASAQIPHSIRKQLKQGLEAFAKCNTSPRKPLHVVWSSHEGWPYSGRDVKAGGDLDIAVLDSSFNPPHLAHLSLAASEPLLATRKARHYGAHLLLLSSRNADKPSNRAGDASAEQRLMMMYQLAKDLEGRLAQDDAQVQPNVAVGIVEEPLMADKSSLIHAWLQEHQAEATAKFKPRLHWVVGFDTLVRFFAVKYYASREALEAICEQYFNKERTTFVCARRVLEDGSGGSEVQSPQSLDDRRAEVRREEDAFLSSELVRPWVNGSAPSVAVFDLPAEAQRASSTLIRKTLMDATKSREEKLDTLTPLLSSRAMGEWLIDEQVYQ